MKKNVAVWVIFLTLNFTVNAQVNKIEEVKFKTSAKCSMCKARIEGDMGRSTGVKSVKLNLDDKTVNISYYPKKVTKQELKIRISKIGYDADEIVANQKSHDALPACCQKDAKPHID